MKNIENKMYFSYILLGLLYFILKTIFYIFGFVYLQGVILGLIATVLTVVAGWLSFREYKEKRKPTTHWIAILIPLIVIPLTPTIMIHNLGEEMYLIEKITILALFECLATAQIVLIARCLMKLKRINEKISV